MSKNESLRFTTASELAHGRRKLRVLVADDERDQVATLAALLMDEGHEVREVYRGTEVVRLVREFDPDIALIVHNSGLSFEALEQRYATRPREEIEAAFNDLVAEMLLVLARLLGREMAQRLAEDFARMDVPNAGSGGTV